MYLKTHYIISMLILLVYSSLATAQIPGMRKYTQIDGYTATTGYEIEQDEKGYIWIGTDNGGMRFDGKAFRLIQGMQSSPDKEILYCRPLGSGRVLLLPLSNAVSYLDKGVLVTAQQDTSLGQIKMGPNRCLSDPVTKTWWLGESSLKTLYRFKDKHMQRYSLKEDATTWSMVIDNKFLGDKTHDGKNYLGMYDLNTRTHHYFHDTAGKRMAVGTWGMIHASGPGYHYITTYEAVTKKFHFFKYTLNDSILQPLIGIVPLPVKKPFGIPIITIDKKNRFWLKLSAPDGGIFFYGDVKEIGKKTLPYQFPEPVLTNSIFIDRNYNVWISTPNNALYFLSEKHFRNLLLTSRFPNKKATPQAISGDGRGGICISYYTQNELTCIRDRDAVTIPLEQSFVGGSRRIFPIDETRFVLICGNIAIFDIRTLKVTYLDIELLFKDGCLYGNRDLLIASVDGVHYIRAPFSKGMSSKMIFHKRTTAVEALPDSTILIGTPNGLYTKQSLDIAAVKINHPLLSECYITDILATKDGHAFIGTNAQGLFMISYPDNRIRSIKLSDGNTPKYIRRLYRQNDSTYWIAADDGAYSMVFDSKCRLRASRHYTFYDGLPSDNVTDVYVCRDTAYFTTMQGLGIIPLKDSSRLKMAPPDVYIDKISIDDTVFYEPDSTVVLSSDQNDLLLSLSALSYESLGNIHFYYQLHPFQDNRIETTNPEVRFTGLPPGTYMFKVYATNAKGVRSKYATVIIHIKPAFWQTIYFKIGVLVLAGALLFFIMRWWIGKREKEKYEKIQQKKHLAELELEAIKAQINPHFIYNCLNSIKYLNYVGEHKHAQEYLSAFARLIRMTMQYSRSMFITLEEESDYLANYLKLEKLRFKDKLEYSIRMQAGINNLQLPAMLLQPYVENALKHGIGDRKEGGYIRIEFRQKGNFLHIFIKDNGPGFLNTKSTDSLGMHLAGTRALSYRELFSLDIAVKCYNEQDYNPGKSGATVEIIINICSYGNTLNQSSHNR